MLLPLWYAILLGIGFILLPILVGICIKLYPPPKYSILRRTISGLGSPEHKSYKIFNPMMSGMGIALLPLPYFLMQALPPTWLTYSGSFVFSTIPIGMIIVGIFHEDKNTGHMTGAILAFGGALITNILLFYPVIQSALSIIITVIQVLVFAMCIPLFYAFIKYISVYEPDEPIQKIYLNINLWEWSAFLSLFAWIIALYINLLTLNM
ncbi:MAG: DUF998 domain-containing protein [Candidatus Helarchaeota archaeon]